MIKVLLLGGLGNQMFQYAAARALASRHDVGVLIDASAFTRYKTHPFHLDRLQCQSSISLKKNFINLCARSRVGRRVLGLFTGSLGVYLERSLSYDPLINLFGDGCYLIGYFQSEKYFVEIREELIQEFKPRIVLSEMDLDLKKAMEEVNSIALHVRRGDYLLSENSQHGTCGKCYYREAVEFVKSKSDSIEPYKVFVFSDDIDWCKQNIAIDTEVFYIDGNTLCPEIDMFLMSVCDHQVISNSSFSWWGAWLNENSKKVVVAPKRWFADKRLESTDIVPEGWVKL